MVNAAVEEFGRLDVLVCIPGVEINAPVDSLEEEDWNAVMDTNLRGTFLCAEPPSRPFGELEAARS